MGAAPGSADTTAITYKEAAAQFGVPTVIKMDIEAHEPMALRGMKRLIENNRPIIILRSESLGT